MKERSKERMAQLLLEELFSELGESEAIRRMLGEMAALPPDVVVGKLVADVEELIARRSREFQESLREQDREHAPGEAQPAPAELPKAEPVPEEPKLHVPPPAPEERQTHGHSPAGSVTPPVISPPPTAEDRKAPAPSPPAKPAPVKPPEVSTREVPVAETPPSPATPVTPPPEGDALFWGELEKTIRGETVEPAKPSRTREPVEEEEDFHGSLAEANAGELRTATEFSDEDVVYLHGVAMIPDRDQPADKPFMLEEKGIDGRSFAFAFDYEGMRFYLSKILPTIMSVSKTGVLLLGKQESLQARGVHESVLNELRLHGILLPFEFGTLARGRDELMGKVDAVRDRLIEALETMEATRWWVVRLFVQDARLAQIVGKDEPAPSRRGRVVERASYTKLPTQKKFDIKMLERILGKEKRIAESVHEELKNMAERSDIDMIVGLGSGSSEDWKLILEASYEVKESNMTKFFQALTDLQYRHLIIDLMISVAGDAEPFSFTPP